MSQRDISLQVPQPIAAQEEQSAGALCTAGHLLYRGPSIAAAALRRARRSQDLVTLTSLGLGQGPAACPERTLVVSQENFRAVSSGEPAG